MATRSKPPPPRQTIEVDMSWLESHPEKGKGGGASAKGSTAKKAPPRIPGGRTNAPPPMPVVPGPPRRETMEVKMEWLEPEAQAEPAAKPPLRRED